MAKKENNGDPIKVKSKTDIPEGAVLVKGEDGREYYEIRSKGATPPSAKSKSSGVEKSSIAKRATGTPPKTTTKTPVKTPPSQEETVKRYYIEPPATTTVTKTPPPLDVAFQGLGWEGKRTLNPKLTENLPPLYIGGKKAAMFGYDVPAKMETGTGVWSSNEGMSTGGAQVFGYTDPTTGEVVLMDLNKMQGKERDVDGQKGRYVYTEEDVVPYVNPQNVAQNLKHGAIRQIGDEAYQSSLGIPVDRTKDVIGPVNTGGTGFGTLKATNKIADLPALTEDPLLQNKKKGGLIEKYASGGPVQNPYIKYDVNSIYNKFNPNKGVGAAVKGINTTITPSITDVTKTGLAGKFNNLNSNQSAGVGSLISLGTDAAGAGIDALDRKDGRSSYAGQIGSGAIKGAGKGAAIGMNPALMAMTGGASAVVAPIAGAAIGGISGGIKAGKEKKQNREITSGELSTAAANSELYDPSQPNKVTKASNYDERDYETIKGKIGDRTSAIKNEGIASVFKGDINKLNPFKVKGGLVSSYSKGGQIAGKGTGTSDSISADIKDKSFIVPAENSGIAKLIRKNVLNEDPNKKAELKQGGVPVKVSNGEHLFTPEEVKELSAKGIDLDKLAPEAQTKLRGEYKFNCGGMMKKYAKGGVADGGPDYASMYKKEYKKKSPSKSVAKPKGLAGLGINTFPTYDPNEENVIIPGSERRVGEPNPLAVPEQYRPKQGLNATQADILNKTALAAEGQNALDQEQKSASKYKFNVGDAVGVGLAGLQAGYGLQQLLKDKRPIGQIDPAYNRATEQALLESKYGYTPAQAALLSGQITQGRVAQTAGINAIAGGNAAVGLNNARAAINSEVANRLKMASEDERLRMQKTQYANQLVGQRAGMSRQLFQDKMNQFQQNQAAGANLLGAGIQNLVGASRYSQEKAAQDQINKTMFGYLNTIPK